MTEKDDLVDFDEVNNNVDWSNRNDTVVISIVTRVKYFNILKEIKTTKQSWFDFLCRDKIVEYGKQQAIEREMEK